jgi:SAM-dependent methyltransferase
MPERDYVLGTHDEELARLGLQHQLWRSYALSAWHRAGIGPGATVLDAGAGPGYASLDLARVVGPSGAVLAVERSARYVDAIRAAAAQHRLTNLTALEADLMTDPVDRGSFDAAWCRWVACFVTSPAMLIDRVAAALRPGGMFVSHEYVDYASWRLIPARPRVERFVADVMESWRDTGGEPDVARLLPELLAARGFTLRHVTPLVFALRPEDAMWRWPATFLRTGLDRLMALDRIGGTEARLIVRELEDAERDPQTIMITPFVLELVAERVST